MQNTIDAESDDIEKSAETEKPIENTPSRMSDHEVENSSSVSVTSKEVSRQITAVTDPLTHQLAHLCKLMPELKNEQAIRRHEGTASFRATSFSSSYGSRDDRNKLLS